MAVMIFRRIACAMSAANDGPDNQRFALPDTKRLFRTGRFNGRVEACPSSRTTSPVIIDHPTPSSRLWRAISTRLSRLAMVRGGAGRCCGEAAQQRAPVWKIRPGSRIVALGAIESADRAVLEDKVVSPERERPVRCLARIGPGPPIKQCAK